LLIALFYPTDEFGFILRRFQPLDLYYKLEVMNAYEITRTSEVEDKYRSGNALHNTWLLYHGTTPTATLGILRRGLQPVKAAASTGFYGAGSRNSP